MKKIDAHLHVAKIVAGYCRRGELRAIGGGRVAWGNGEEMQLFPQGYGEVNFTAERALEIMDEHDVERAVLMQGSMYGFQNRYHEEILRKYPDRFCPSFTIDPFMTDYLTAVDRFVEQENFRLMKFEVSSGGGLMGCHDSFSLMDRRMQEIYRRIEARKGVLALDVGDITMASHQPLNLRRIAEVYPGLKLVVCHLLAPVEDYRAVWEESLKILTLPNIYFDIAALPKIIRQGPFPFEKVQNYLRTAIDILGADRLMWGTDAPYAATENSYRELSDYLEGSRILSADELERIYYKNAFEVYFKK